jgi:hypothetical protein
LSYWVAEVDIWSEVACPWPKINAG